MTNQKLVRQPKEDDGELLDEQWLRQFCTKKPCHGGVILHIRGTEFELYKLTSPPTFGYCHWIMFKSLDDGDEMDICVVRKRGEILNLLSFLAPEGGEWDNVEPERASD